MIQNMIASKGDGKERQSSGGDERGHSRSRSRLAVAEPRVPILFLKLIVLADDLDVRCEVLLSYASRQAQ